MTQETQIYALAAVIMLAALHADTLQEVAQTVEAATRIARDTAADPATALAIAVNTIDDVTRLRGSAGAAYGSGAYLRAAEMYTNALLTSTATPEGDMPLSVLCAALRLNRAAAHMAGGEPERALFDCDAVLGCFPHHEKAQLRRARARRQLCMWAEAAADLRAVLAERRRPGYAIVPATMRVKDTTAQLKQELEQALRDESAARDEALAAASDDADYVHGYTRGQNHRTNLRRLRPPPQPPLDYLAVLGLPQLQSHVGGRLRKPAAAEITRVYRLLAIRLHPDKCNTPDADEAFKAVNAAVAVLKDEALWNDHLEATEKFRREHRTAAAVAAKRSEALRAARAAIVAEVAEARTSQL